MIRPARGFRARGKTKILQTIALVVIVAMLGGALASVGCGGGGDGDVATASVYAAASFLGRAVDRDSRIIVDLWPNKGAVAGVEYTVTLYENHVKRDSCTVIFSLENVYQGAQQQKKIVYFAATDAEYNEWVSAGLAGESLEPEPLGFSAKVTKKGS